MFHWQFQYTSQPAESTITITSPIYSSWWLVLTDNGGRTVFNVRAGCHRILFKYSCSYTPRARNLICSIPRFLRPSLVVHHEWSVLPDLHGTDHYPANIHVYTPCPNPSWHLNKIIKCADWVDFSVSNTRWWGISISPLQVLLWAASCHIPWLLTRPGPW
jgi:hypothetical protein